MNITHGLRRALQVNSRGIAILEGERQYMAAPERFAEKSNSSCTAGTVHTSIHGPSRRFSGPPIRSR